MGTRPVPAQWRAMLHTLKAHGFPEAVIAGGCLRDLVHGREIKDVDVFVYGSNGDYEIIAELTRAFPTAKITHLVCPEAGQYVFGESEVAEVIDLQIEGHDHPYQIIAVNAEQDDLSDYAMQRVDFGLCRISYDGETVHVSEAFHRDSVNMTFTLLRCENVGQLDRSIKRFGRFTEKYPGWKFVDGTEDGWYRLTYGDSSVEDMLDLMVPRAA